MFPYFLELHVPLGLSLPERFLQGPAPRFHLVADVFRLSALGLVRSYLAVLYADFVQRLTQNTELLPSRCSLTLMDRFVLLAERSSPLGFLYVGSDLLNVFQASKWPTKYYNTMATMSSPGLVGLHSLEATGRAGGVRFFASGSYSDDQGAIKGLTGDQQRRGRVNLDYDAAGRR